MPKIFTRIIASQYQNRDNHRLIVLILARTRSLFLARALLFWGRRSVFKLWSLQRCGREKGGGSWYPELS